MKIGITERGDAGIDFSWVEKLYPANVIISKNLNDKLIANLVKNKGKIIFHMTCTGFGGTIIEPNVPNVDFTYNQIVKLINEGFPVGQITLRIDPIIPTEKGLCTVENLLQKFENTGIKRIRYSFLDMYPHVKKRFEENSIKLPYTDFTAPKEMINNAILLFDKYENIYEFESCAEYTKHRLGCISQKDLDILGIEEKIEASGFQRKACLCASGKTELLASRTRCPHQCLYCYWKD